MLEIAGINVVQVIEVVVALAATYLATRTVSKALAKVFEKTPFPEEVERGIAKGVKYVIYIVGVFVVISL